MIDIFSSPYYAFIGMRYAGGLPRTSYRNTAMNRSVSLPIFILSLLGFLLLSCTSISPVNEPVRAVDLAMSDEFYEQASVALEELRINDAFVYLLKSLERNPDNIEARQTYERLNESLVSESHFMKESITRGRGMEHPLSFLLYYRSEDETLPVADIPVRFAFVEGTGNLTEHAVTNDAGIAKCFVEEIDSYERGVTIEAVPYVGEAGRSVSLDNLARRYVFSTVSLLEQTQHVYILFDNFESTDRNANNKQFSHIQNSLMRLFHDNEFHDVQFHYMTEKILFNRAQDLDRSSIDILTDAENLFLIQVRTSFLSQQSTDFFFSDALISLEIIDTNTPRIVFSEEVNRRGAGRTKSNSAFQAVVNTVNEISPKLDLYLKEARRLHGV
jgi:hypothetical protein